MYYGRGHFHDLNSIKYRMILNTRSWGFSAIFALSITGYVCDLSFYNSLTYLMLSLAVYGSLGFIFAIVAITIPICDDDEFNDLTYIPSNTPTKTYIGRIVYFANTLCFSAMCFSCFTYFFVSPIASMQIVNEFLSISFLSALSFLAIGYLGTTVLAAYNPFACEYTSGLNNHVLSVRGTAYHWGLETITILIQIVGAVELYRLSIGQVSLVHMQPSSLFAIIAIALSIIAPFGIILKEICDPKVTTKRFGCLI